jgi:hypothetical protein
MRRSFKIAGVGCGVLVSLAACALGWLAWTLRPQPPDSALPAFVRNLPRDNVERRSAFRERVQARFHDGISSDAMAAELRHDGFFLYNDKKSGLVFANLHQQGFPCVQDWLISWRPDPQGRAQQIDAHFNPGCL